MLALRFAMPGRFDRIVKVSLPSVADREVYLVRACTATSHTTRCVTRLLLMSLTC